MSEVSGQWRAGLLRSVPWVAAGAATIVAPWLPWATREQGVSYSTDFWQLLSSPNSPVFSVPAWLGAPLVIWGVCLVVLPLAARNEPQRRVTYLVLGAVALVAGGPLCATYIQSLSRWPFDSVGPGIILVTAANLTVIATAAILSRPVAALRWRTHSHRQYRSVRSDLE